MIDVSTLLMIAAIIGGFLIVFPLFWCAVVLFLAYAGGWKRLARSYCATVRPPEGAAQGGLWGMVGWVSYRYVLEVHVVEEGFFIGVMPLFRVGHPRLFIPWEAVSARRPVLFAFWKAERLSIGNPAVAVMTLPQGVLPDPFPVTRGGASPAHRSG